MKHSSRISVGVFAAIVAALVVGAGLWFRNEWIESQRRSEERHAEHIAMWIADAKRTRSFHSGYEPVSPDDWRRVGELGHLESVRQIQCGHVDGRAMLEHVDTEAISLAGLTLQVGDPDGYPSNGSVQDVGFTRVLIEGDLATFVAAMPQLESVSLARMRFPANVEDAQALERGLSDATQLKSVSIDDEQIADRLRKRFPKVEFEIDRRSDDDIYP